MFSNLATSSIIETTLLVGGFIAILIGIVGKSEKTSADEIALFLGFFVGVFMIFMGIMLYSEGSWPPSTMIVLIVLGLGLFFRVFRKMKWAAIIAWIVGDLIGYGLYLLSKIALASVLTPTIILVIVLIVMLIVYLLLKFLEDTVSLLGAILSFRPILIFLGMGAIIEAVLLFLGTSLYAIFR
ncbi:MAG: hypothetical protein ABSB83_07025 [Methanomassiliicoccales archaeon]|jgi:hypothetical protein